MPRLEEAGVPADALGPVVSGILDKCLIDIFDFRLEIGDDDAIRALLHGQKKLADLRFARLALGNVADEGIELDTIADLD